MGAIVDISEVLLQLGLSSSVTEEERAFSQVAIGAAEAAVKRYLKYDPLQQSHTEYFPQSDFRQEGRIGIWEATDTQAYVRELSQFVSNELQVTHLPVRSITSLKVDYDGRNGAKVGAFPDSSAKVEGVDFWPNYDGADSSGNKICRDGIIRSQGAWPDVAGCVKIVYVAGYSIAELHGQDTVIDASAIVEAIIDEAVRRVLKMDSRKKKRLTGFAGPLSSENMGDYSYSTNATILQKLIGGDLDLLPETEMKLQEFARLDLGVM